MGDRKAVYVGAGWDVSPLSLDFVDTYWHIDSQPFSEFGTSTSYVNGINIYSRPNFTRFLDGEMTNKNMTFQKSERPNRRYTFQKRVYKYGSKIVNYLINTSFPEHWERMKNIEGFGDFGVLVVKGYDPHHTILDFCIPEGICWVGYISISPQSIKNKDKYSLNTWLAEDKDGIRSRFSTFKLVDEQNNIHTFETWEQYIAAEANIMTAM